jgi:uncharacterized protein (TIGR02284 family)
MSQPLPVDTLIQINILNDITRTLIDSYQGYKMCLNDFKENEKVKSQFTERATNRSQMILEFQNAVEALGGEPATEGTVSGTVHRGWTKLTTLFQDDEQAARQAVDDGEAFLVERIQESLREPDLIPPVHELLSKAYISARNGERFAEMLETSH